VFTVIILGKRCCVGCGVWGRLEMWPSRLLDGLGGCLMGLGGSVQQDPVESPEFFGFVGQLLGLSGRCEGRVFI